MSRGASTTTAAVVVPRLGADRYKGQAGKLAVLGGSLEYTGAPFLAAMSAMRVGVDLGHVFCTPDAAVPIKSYSPDLIVHPLLRSDARSDEEVDQAASDIERWFPSLHALVIGPGLGRNESVMRITRSLLSKAARSSLHAVILDGDGLWAIREHHDLVRQLGARAVLTPNRAEWQRLQAQLALNDTEGGEAVSRLLNGAVVVRKGEQDAVSDSTHTVLVADEGSLKRCGGQGDVLAGAVGAFCLWGGGPSVAAAAAACRVVRRAAALAWASHRRAMLASDMLHCVGPAMDELHPVTESRL